MNVVRENRENQTAVIKVTVTEADYSAEVDKKLREYRRKANVPGFRPGMVPMGLINKMYRKGTIAETAYKFASDACFDYIGKEKIDYMGDVLPCDEQGAFDFENNKEHEFVFELGLAPEVNIDLSDKDKLTRYEIEITDDMRAGFRTNFLRRYGHLVDVEAVTDDEAITGVLDNGEIIADDAYIGLVSMSEEERKQYIGKKVGDQFTVNVEELYKSRSQRASVLGVKEHELDSVVPEFKFTINKIRKFAEPEMNDEFFGQAFPEGNIKDGKAFDKYVEERIAAELERESEFVFTVELRNYLVEKAGLSLPEDFLKRWLFTINEGKFSLEDIERDLPQFLNMMRWNLIQKKLSEKLDLKLEQEEVLDEAKKMAAQQFAQYGLMNMEDAVLANYAQSILENKEEANKIVESLYEKKIVAAVAPLVKISTKTVSAEELGKIFEKINK